MLYELIWRGEDIWEDVDHLQSVLSKAHDTNPHVFNAYIKALGLDTFFSFGSQDNVRLLAELSPYYDRTIPKNQPQSDTYYMHVCIALAYYAREIGEEPFGSIVVAQGGKIIGAAYNEIEKHHGDQTRHAEVIAIERAKVNFGNKIPFNSLLFTTCAPCSLCTHIIRAHKRIRNVRCGTISMMSDLVGLTDDFDDEREKFETMGDPYGKPPQLKVGILPLQIEQLYKPLQWNKMFPQYEHPNSRNQAQVLASQAEPVVV